MRWLVYYLKGMMTMSVNIAPPPRLQFVDANGNPYVGAKLFTYLAGTTTKYATYRDSTQATANSNPIVLDSSGRAPYGVWLIGGIGYKFVLAPSTDTDPPTSPILTEDHIQGVNDLNASTTQWLPTALTPIYDGATQFHVVGDETAIFQDGRRLKLHISTGYIYATVSSSVFTTYTTVNLINDSTTIDSTIDSIEVSILSSLNPAVPILTGFDGGGSNNTAYGVGAMHVNTGSHNQGFGTNALYANTSGEKNTAVGLDSCSQQTTQNFNSGLGYRSLLSNTAYSNCTGLGANAAITGDNQVQLGDSATTTYAYGAVQNRSDRRDKTDIKPTILGLDFINRLTPVDFRWDLRDDYRNDANHLDNVTSDGTKKRSRFHHGLIAQDVRMVINDTGLDFGGFQNHKHSGGDDVMSLGYSEFIAPLIKAIQELSDKVAALESKLP
jgi:hypothetical protein